MDLVLLVKRNVGVVLSTNALVYHVVMWSLRGDSLFNYHFPCPTILFLDFSFRPLTLSFVSRSPLFKTLTDSYEVVGSP